MKHKYYPVEPISDLKELVRKSTDKFADRVAFQYKKDGKYAPITYKEFRADLEAFGTYLYANGMKGKRIVVAGENCYQWALTYLSVTCGDGIIVPVDKELPADEIHNIAKISDSSMAIVADAIADKVKDYDFGEGYRIIRFSEIAALIEEGNALLQGGNTEYLDTDPNAEVMSILLFTSGTTGSSKGVMLSQRNICTNIMEMNKMALITEEDTFLSVLPLHHTYECTCGFLVPLYKGASIAYCEKLSLVAKNLGESHATVILCVPLLVDTMYKKIWLNAEKKGMADKLRTGIKLNNVTKKFGVDLSKKLFATIHESFGGKLRLIVCGGAAASPEVMKGLRDMGFLTLQGYGLTECAPLAAVNRDVNFRDDSAGLATPNGQLAIFEPDENGIGEIIYKGDNVMLGYYNAPELTAEVIRDGWYYTGDLGYITRDGFLHITGRKKNVIVTENGKNIFPEEIEEYLGRYDTIKESMVIGDVDSAGCVCVKAIVYPDYELLNTSLAESGITTDSEEYASAVKSRITELVNEINANIPTYKRIRKVSVRRNEFVKTTTKKIRRFDEANKNGEEL